LGDDKANVAKNFVQDIRGIINQARTQAVRSVEFHRVQMYWQMGERIFNEEPQGIALTQLFPVQAAHQPR